MELLGDNLTSFQHCSKSDMQTSLFFMILVLTVSTIGSLRKPKNRLMGDFLVGLDFFIEVAKFRKRRAVA
jgi:hypothetical protein